MKPSDSIASPGEELQEFLLVRNPDGNAGFCALITYALNGARLAAKNGWLPVVDFDRETCPLFFDPDRGSNVWEYYFEPVKGVSSGQLGEMLGSGHLSGEAVHEFDPRLMMDLHHSDPERIATFWARDEPEDPRGWMKEKRALGREYVGSYVRVRSEIQSKVDEFVEANMLGAFTFGAHVRGTDFAYAEPTPPEAYFREIHRIAEERELGSFRVFLATDQAQFVDIFQAEFGDAVLTYDALRSSDDVAPFRLGGVSPYKKGEDVLIDTLLMSRTDYLLKCAAAGGEYAMWFNPALECTDFGLASSFDTRRYQMLESAYLKLNVDEKGSLALRIRRLQGILWGFARGRDWLAAPRAIVRRIGGFFGRRG